MIPPTLLSTAQRATQYLREINIIILMSLCPLIYVICLPFKLLVILLSGLRSSHGEFLDWLRVCMYEDYVNSNPRINLITSVVLEGDLTLEEVKQLFRDNVLEATIPTDKYTDDNKQVERIRYPEFKQYVDLFMGYLIWRNDPDFDLDNHVIEKPNLDHVFPSTNIFDLASLHGDLINKRFERRRSPWELVLIRQVFVEDDISTPKTVLALRLHHVLGDGKSMLKLFVECLGKNRLRIPAAQTPSNKGVLSRISEKLFLPFDFLGYIFKVYYFILKYPFHPLKTLCKGEGKLSEWKLTFSEKLYLKDVKQVAKFHGIATSSVLLAIIANALRKYVPGIENGGVPLVYILPKKNHPETLANHMHLGFTFLPTDEKSSTKRLYQLDKIFKKLKSSKHHLYNDWVAQIGGRLHKFFVDNLSLRENHAMVMVVTNIAGMQDEFNVGGLPCIDFSMSVGSCPGSPGVSFCIFSYKDHFRIQLVGRDCIMDDKTAEAITVQLGKELEILTRNLLA